MVATANARSECDNDMGRLNWIESSASNVLTLMLARLSRRGNKACLRSFSSVNGAGIESESACKEENRNLNDLRLTKEAGSDCCEVFASS